MLQSILAALLLSMDFEGGYIPQWSTLIYKTPQDYQYSAYQHSFYVTMIPSVEYKGLRAELDFTYYVSPMKSQISFTPYRAKWSSEISYTYSFVSIGYNHMCAHSITPEIYRTEGGKNIDGAYDRVFLKFSFSNKPTL